MFSRYFVSPPPPKNAYISSSIADETFQSWTLTDRSPKFGIVASSFLYQLPGPEAGRKSFSAPFLCILVYCAYCISKPEGRTHATLIVFRSKSIFMNDNCYRYRSSHPTEHFKAFALRNYEIFGRELG